MKKITILGNYSGRNAGDAAILGCLLEDIYNKFEDYKINIDLDKLWEVCPFRKDK